MTVLIEQFGEERCFLNKDDFFGEPYQDFSWSAEYDLSHASWGVA